MGNRRYTGARRARKLVRNANTAIKSEAERVAACSRRIEREAERAALTGADPEEAFEPLNGASKLRLNNWNIW